MEKTRLGRTNLWVTRSAFGALPIQRTSLEEAQVILRKAYEGGINFFDTARGYTDSEQKLGLALSDVRDQIAIATKCSGAKDRADVLRMIETSLEKLKTDHVDILQLHNPGELPDPEDANSTYRGLLEAREQGMTRFVGITNHKLDMAIRAVESGLYDTIQFPLSAISSDRDLTLIDVAKAHDVGVIAMKALCGGLLTDARLAFAAMRRFDNVVPIWGIQRESELDEFLALEADPPQLDAEMLAAIEREKAELSGDFCRACGYCLPCPMDIPIPMAARMSYAIRRMPSARFFTPEWQEQMRRIENCLECRECADRCPYELDTPALLKRMLAEYLAMLEAA